MFQIGHSHWPGCGCEKLRTTKTLQWCIGMATVLWSIEISWPQLLKKKWRDGFLKAKWRDGINCYIKDGRSRHLLPSFGRLSGNRRQQSTSTKVTMILRYSISETNSIFVYLWGGVFRKTKWIFLMKFSMKGGGGGLELHYGFSIFFLLKNHLESLPGCQNMFCT